MTSTKEKIFISNHYLIKVQIKTYPLSHAFVCDGIHFRSDSPKTFERIELKLRYVRFKNKLRNNNYETVV